MEFNYVTIHVIWYLIWKNFSMDYIYKLVTVALRMATYIWEDENAWYLSSSMFYMCGVNRMYNSILKIPWWHWFSYPDLYFSQNGLDIMKSFHF